MMKTIKVQDLHPGPQMDALVAEVRGWKLIDGAWCKTVFAGNEDDWPVIDESDYNPSTNGGQAMELVKEFDISVHRLLAPDMSGAKWSAQVGRRFNGGSNVPKRGLTPEIAICRAIIASVFGETVEVEE